ncbi:MAG: transcription factor S [Candidatus Hadarchaeales archaeon]
MKFCKCGGLLVPKPEEEGVLVCQLCGKEEKAEGSEYRMVKKVEEKGDVVVIEEEEPSTLPTTRAKCPKCGHDKAYWWMRQTRSADEPSTRFYRCVKCGNTWREYA